MLRRKKSGKDVFGWNTIADLIYNFFAGAIRVMPIYGALSPIGALGTAKPFLKGQLIAVFNNSASVAFVKFGGPTVTAPTGPADGIPVKPYDYAYVVLTDNYIIANSANVFAYSTFDDGYVIDINE